VSGEQEENYRKFFESDEIERVFEETIFEKLAITQIVSLLRKRPLTTSEIASAVGLSPSEVSKHLATSSRHRLVRYDQEQKRYALSVGASH
jgi:DNA-binding transcriptional ArsR family regulator